MNSSAVSEYENVHSQKDSSKSVVYRTINDLLSVNGDVEIRIYCPLCVNSFDYKFSLFEHLRTFHNNFLTEASNQSLRFKECPFCSAKFYGRHLTAKHVLLHHSKVIRELFLIKKSFKCFFCELKLNKKDSLSVGKHIEEFHFFDFEEEFKKMFSCDSILEMTMSELINSSTHDENADVNWEDVCMDVGKHSGTKQSLSDSNIGDFEEASKLNCYDFTDLKKQLESIKNLQSNKSESGNKSILKDVKNCASVSRKSARRVLRFDLPLPDEDKENSSPKQTFGSCEEINDEFSLLCADNQNEINKYFSRGSWCGEPQGSSTPNSAISKSKGKILVKDENRRKKFATFKSYITHKKTNAFEFQCGKCRELFKENLELVCHVKNNHKKLMSLNMWQPCYRCAICNARFYKNYYLKKHHNLHKPN